MKDSRLTVRVPNHTKERLRAQVATDADPTGGAVPRWYVTELEASPDDTTVGPGNLETWVDGSWEAGSWDGETAVALSPTLVNQDADATFGVGTYRVWCDVTPGATEEPIRWTHTLIVY